MSERGGAHTRLYLLRHGLVHNPDELAYGPAGTAGLNPGLDASSSANYETGVKAAAETGVH